MAENRDDLSRRIASLLTILNCLLLCLGDTGGPILLRLYFLHGGHRQWLSSFLETAGFPLLLIPLSVSYLHRRRSNPSTPFIHLNIRLLIASAIIGILTGLDDFLYAYGLDFLPVSTAIVLTATHLGFTAFFAFLIVRQRFTPFSINAIALLTVGAAVLALHANGDRPDGVSPAGYWKGFFLTIGAAAFYGLVLPLVELAYGKAERVVSYTLVIEMQFVMGFFSTAFCVVGMIVNKDFQVRNLNLFGSGLVRCVLAMFLRRSGGGYLLRQYSARRRHHRLPYSGHRSSGRRLLAREIQRREGGCSDTVALGIGFLFLRRVSPTEGRLRRSPFPH